MFSPVELAPKFFVSRQITPEDMAAARARGVTLIVNNRPEGEEAGQPAGDDIAKAAAREGIDYIAIPIGAAGVSDAALDAFDAALAANAGAVLAFCRSGMRSTVLRALARARAGASPGALIEEAKSAGYDIGGLAPRLAALGGSK